MVYEEPSTATQLGLLKKSKSINRKGRTPQPPQGGALCIVT